MSIKKIYIKNFKSFKEQEIELGNFNVLIGANASGKSNFVQVFEFLKNLKEDGLENAVSLQGGFEYLRNLMERDDKEIHISLKGEMSDLSKTFLKFYIFPAPFTEYQIKDYPEFEYEIKFLIKNKELVFNERSVLEMKIENKGYGKISMIDNNYLIFKITFENENGRVKPPVVESSDLNIFDPVKIKENLFERVSILFDEELKDISSKLLLKFLEFGDKKLFKISIYNFDPKVIKNPSSIRTKLKLEEDGRNLTVKLKNLLKDQNDKKKLLDLIHYALPFIKNFEFEYPTAKSITFKLIETFNLENYLPASFISDGTINVIALIVALYFEDDPIKIFEEPERNIHPYLISKIVEMMKDASKNNQIIITTHNPEIVKYSGLENLLLISRNKEGFSEITRPANKEVLKIFLENQIGLDELFVQNLLEI